MSATTTSFRPFVHLKPDQKEPRRVDEGYFWLLGFVAWFCGALVALAVVAGILARFVRPEIAPKLLGEAAPFLLIAAPFGLIAILERSRLKRIWEDWTGWQFGRENQLFLANRDLQEHWFEVFEVTQLIQLPKEKETAGPVGHYFLLYFRCEDAVCCAQVPSGTFLKRSRQMEHPSHIRFPHASYDDQGNAHFWQEGEPIEFD